VPPSCPPLGPATTSSPPFLQQCLQWRRRRLVPAVRLFELGKRRAVLPSPHLWVFIPGPGGVLPAATAAICAFSAHRLCRLCDPSLPVRLLGVALRAVPRRGCAGAVLGLLLVLGLVASSLGVPRRSICSASAPSLFRGRRAHLRGLCDAGTGAHRFPPQRGGCESEAEPAEESRASEVEPAVRAAGCAGWCAWVKRGALPGAGATRTERAARAARCTPLVLPSLAVRSARLGSDYDWQPRSIVAVRRRQACPWLAGPSCPSQFGMVTGSP
jgi:hypothetical protein